MSGLPAASRDNNFDALGLLAAASAIFSHSFLSARGWFKDNQTTWRQVCGGGLLLAGVLAFVSRHSIESPVLRLKPRVGSVAVLTTG